MSVTAEMSSPQSIDCNHIVAFRRCSFPQHGEIDRLVLKSEDVSRDDELLVFNYCPVCGLLLNYEKGYKELARAPHNKPLPLAIELTGSDSDFTGTISTDEYIRSIRSG